MQGTFDIKLWVINQKVVVWTNVGVEVGFAPNVFSKFDNR